MSNPKTNQTHVHSKNGITKIPVRQNLCVWLNFITVLFYSPQVYLDLRISRGMSCCIEEIKNVPILCYLFCLLRSPAVHTQHISYSCHFLMFYCGKHVARKAEEDLHTISFTGHWVHTNTVYYTLCSILYWCVFSVLWMRCLVPLKKMLCWKGWVALAT